MYIYHQFSKNLFQGFYESNLFNSDTEYYLSENLGSPYEIADFKAFQMDVAKKAVSLLDPDNEFLSDFKLESISSPRYYNFETDRLVISCNANFDLLRQYALETNRKAFDEYLHEQFTSYDGFISFVPNNVAEFELDIDHWSDILIEFYLLTNTDLDSYNYDLEEYASDQVYEYAEPVNN